MLTDAEGSAHGTANETAALNVSPGTVDQVLALYDEWGGPNTLAHFAMGWAWASSTPDPWVTFGNVQVMETITATEGD